MEKGVVSRTASWVSSYGRIGAVILALLAVVSPLYIDREVREPEDEPEPLDLAAWLPVLLLVLIMAIIFSGYSDRSLSRLDPYWIHRVGGSSVGITILLMVLALILKCKASLKTWEF